MSKSITQDMAYWQPLMKYAEKYGVSRDSRKYTRSCRLYISVKDAGMAVQTSAQPSQTVHRCRVEANLLYTLPQSKPATAVILWATSQSSSSSATAAATTSLREHWPGFFPQNPQTNMLNEPMLTFDDSNK